jgi:hypothetical protein
MPNTTNPNRISEGIVAAKSVFLPSSTHIPLSGFLIIPAVRFRRTGAVKEMAILPIKPKTQNPLTIPI